MIIGMTSSDAKVKEYKGGRALLVIEEEGREKVDKCNSYTGLSPCDERDRRHHNHLRTTSCITVAAHPRVIDYYKGEGLR